MSHSSSSQNIKSILPKIREFMQTEVYPLEKQASGVNFNQILPALEEKREKVKEAGLWTPQLPKKWGGPGLSLAEFGQISEELGRSPYGHYIFNCQAPDAGNMEILVEHGTQEQHNRFLWPLLRGEIRSCFAMTEPEHAGSNPVMMSTTAIKDGQDFVLNGHKWFASAADGAAFAIVMAVTDSDAENPYKRASMLIVPAETSGFIRVRNIPVMGEAGEGYASHAELRFENCRVPLENLLGKRGEGFAIAQERLGPGRIHHCMRWVGICERAFDMMCRRAATRELAPGKLRAMQQTIRNWIAECRVELNAARLLVLDAAQKIDSQGAYTARVEISAIKFYVANVLQKVLDYALQTHGALGMTDDTLLAYWFRHERAARIYDGPDEVHKSRVAREILRGYGVSG
jgi:alkylation response protein AidB-like acyl-CoA dehydrogenase